MGESFDLVLYSLSPGESHNTDVLQVGPLLVTQARAPTESVELNSPYVLMLGSSLGWRYQFETVAELLAAQGVQTVVAMDRSAPGIEGALSGRVASPRSPEDSSKLGVALLSELAALETGHAELLSVFAFGDMADVFPTPPAGVRTVAFDSFRLLADGINILSRKTTFSILSPETQFDAIKAQAPPSAIVGLFDPGIGILQISYMCSFEPDISGVIAGSAVTIPESLVSELDLRCTSSGRQLAASAQQSLVELLLDENCNQIQKLPRLEFVIGAESTVCQQ
jgi:hypothetical protein